MLSGTSLSGLTRGSHSTSGSNLLQASTASHPSATVAKETDNATAKPDAVTTAANDHNNHSDHTTSPSNTNTNTPYSTLVGQTSETLNQSTLSAGHPSALDNANPSSANLNDSSYVSPCGCWKGNSVDSFQWLDIDKKAKDMYIDIKYTHDFKIRGPTYMSDKKKVRTRN